MRLSVGEQVRFQNIEAQCFVKVLKSLLWAFSGKVGVVEDNNFTRKTLFHSPNFGEGIATKDAF